MYYYEIQIAGKAYHSKKPLTYMSESQLRPGTIVSVPVRNKTMSGFVLQSVKKPDFAARTVSRVDNSPPLSATSIELYHWLETYYPSPASTALQLFMPSSILKHPHTPLSSSAKHAKSQKKPPLRHSQKQALEYITRSNQRSFLLHGETGSGKTRIYSELAERSIEEDRSVLILTPEIGLTAQLAAHLQQLTKHKIIILHSRLTPKERRERWRQIATDTSPYIVIGTRLSLFAPYTSLGLIVVDECHEDAYKQEQSPHYHASRVAAQLAKIHKARLVLGSATPSVADYALFRDKKLPIISVPAPKEHIAHCDIIDLKDRSQFTESPYLSKKLLLSMTRALDSGEQSLIYLNRRGTARLVLCQNCGWEHLCPNCDISLTFHDDTHTMRCHTCGFTTKPPAACPVCKKPDIFYKQIGTKALIKHVQNLFPDARIARFDTDLSKDERLEARYDAIRLGEIDILIGTQMLGKGLDLPKLRVAGVVQADNSLSLPDFSAREKTYQQLHQIIGRVGRGHSEGHVVIQTYNPNSLLVTAAARKDYTSFLESELAERKNFLYPPYCHLLQITSSRKQPKAAETVMNAVADSIRRLALKVQIVGPSPAFKYRAHGSYHWQLTVKSKQRSYLLKIIETLPTNIRYDIDPVNLL